MVISHICIIGASLPVVNGFCSSFGWNRLQLSLIRIYVRKMSVRLFPVAKHVKYIITDWILLIVVKVNHILDCIRYIWRKMEGLSLDSMHSLHWTQSNCDTYLKVNPCHNRFNVTEHWIQTLPKIKYMAFAILKF